MRKFSPRALAVAMLSMLLMATAAAGQPVRVQRADGAEVPLEVYAPPADECPRLALISPGAGGTEAGMKYLAAALRDQGWLAIVLGHRESGPDALSEDIRAAGLRGGLLKLTTDPAAYRGRMMDIAAALKWADARCHAPFLALIGHSMGAATVMIEAGARDRLGVAGADRFDAYVALSPQGPGSIFPSGAWRGIRKPMLILTGTRDGALEGGWESRTRPYDDLPAGCKWLGVIDGARHMQFAGVGFSGDVERIVLRLTAAFLAGAQTGRCTAPPTPPMTKLNVK